MIENTVTIGGAYEASVRLGSSTLLRVLVDPGGGALADGCRLDIDPGAI